MNVDDLTRLGCCYEGIRRFIQWCGGSCTFQRFCEEYPRPRAVFWLAANWLPRETFWELCYELVQECCTHVGMVEPKLTAETIETLITQATVRYSEPGPHAGSWGPYGYIYDMLHMLNDGLLVEIGREVADVITWARVVPIVTRYILAEEKKQAPDDDNYEEYPDDHS